MAYDTGYSTGLQIDGLTDNDINAALRNSGSDYQLPAEQQSGGADAQGIVSGLLGGITDRQEAAPPPVFQTSSTQAPSTWQQPQQPQEQQSRNLLSKALGVVGSIYGGGTGAALGAASKATAK